MSEAETFDEQKATLEILSNPKLREEALKGKEQARLGKTRKLDDVKKELCL